MGIMEAKVSYKKDRMNMLSDSFLCIHLKRSEVCEDEEMRWMVFLQRAVNYNESYSSPLNLSKCDLTQFLKFLMEEISRRKGIGWN